MVIDLLIAASWIACVVDPFGTALGTTTATATTRLLAFGGVCWAALAHVRWSAVCAFVYWADRMLSLAWRMFGYFGLPRVDGVRVDAGPVGG